MLNPAGAEERRQAYYALRRGGVPMWEAARQVGVDEPATIRRYERWYEVFGKEAGDAEQAGA